MVYGVVVMVGCFSIFLYMWVKGKYLLFDLVKVDFYIWMIDGVLSVFILFVFILVYVLELMEYRILLLYVDFVLLIIFGLVMLLVFFKILCESFNEVINKVLFEVILVVIEKKFKKMLVDVLYEYVEVWISKWGRDVYLLVYIIVDDVFLIVMISELDEIWLKCEVEMCEWDFVIIMDILFIKDFEFVE